MTLYGQGFKEMVPGSEGPRVQGSISPTDPSPPLQPKVERSETVKSPGPLSQDIPAAAEREPEVERSERREALNPSTLTVEPEPEKPQISAKISQNQTNSTNQINQSNKNGDTPKPSNSQPNNSSNPMNQDGQRSEVRGQPGVERSETSLTPNAYRRVAVVKSGDTLALLAISIYGRWDQDVLRLIQKHNPGLEDVNRILVGQRIVFPPITEETR